MTQLITKLEEEIQQSLGLSSSYNVHQNLRISERNLLDKGDVVLPLQPVLLDLQLSDDNSDQKQLTENICCKLIKSFLISNAIINKDTIRIFVDKRTALMHYCDIFNSISNRCTTDASISPWNIEIVHHTPEEKKSTVRHLRGELTSNLIQDILNISEGSGQVIVNSTEKLQMNVYLILYSDSLRGFNTKLRAGFKLATSLNGPVTDVHLNSNAGIIYEHDYIRQVKHELDAASRHKLGDSLKGEKWERYLQEQATSCSRLQLLSVAHHSPIKISTSGDYINSRDSSFILYNFARIKMIFNNFDELVFEQCVPSMPPIQKVDFTLLTYQEEWELYWTCVQYWPSYIFDIKQDIANKLESTNTLSDDLNTENVIGNLSKLKNLNFPLHKIVNFLHRLSHKLSVYYKSVHILPSKSFGRVPSHLLSKLWPRLYLLKGLQLTMMEAFGLLRINPPDIM